MGVPVVTWEQYAADWSGLHGGVDLRKVRPGVRRWLWLGFVVARSLHRARVPAGAVTALGLLSSVMVVVVVTHGSGGMLLAALLVVVATLADTVDGALAVLSGHTTRLGYVYDAVVDRIGEACWLIALWRIGAAGHVVVAAGALAWLHEYVRSRGNAAGMTEITAVTVGERPTRIMLTIGGLALAGLADTFNPHVAAGIAAFTAAAWIVLGLIGIAQLLAAVHRALAGRRWPTWRTPGTSNAATPSVPPAPVRPYAGGPAMPTDPIGAADRSDERGWNGGTFVGPVSGGRPASAPGRDAGDRDISEVVSYAAPSADEPSDPSPDLALREPTLDDLLGDAGVRVRSAVEKYGRSVTVYRSQAAGAPEVDDANATGASDAPLVGDSVAGTESAADIDGRSATGVGSGDPAGPGGAFGPGGAVGSDSPVGSGGVVGPGGAVGPGGPGGTGRGHATEPELEPQSFTGTEETPAGPGPGPGTAARNPARIRFGRRARGGAAQSVAEDAGRGPGQGATQGSEGGGGA